MSVDDEHNYVSAVFFNLLQPIADLRKLLYLGIGDLELEPRNVRMLEDIGIHNVGALASRTEAELLADKGFKKKDVDRIDSYLRRLGLTLGIKFDESLWTNST
jgi:DNA-directed RNA polymerase alpha subunit